eukprot:3671104-Alexandrium_andersonii.AAC.1
MDMCEQTILSLGLEFSNLDWYQVSPLHYWFKTRPCQPLRRSGLPAPADHLAHSICVVNYAQTSSGGDLE